MYKYYGCPSIESKRKYQKEAINFETKVEDNEIEKGPELIDVDGRARELMRELDKVSCQAKYGSFNQILSLGNRK